MIPRTSIDEANKHLQQLHKRVHELETTVSDQHEAFLCTEKMLQSQIEEVSSSKDGEIDSLTDKLLASERTVSILQEELERKNQLILALQHSHSKLKRLLNFKDDIKDILTTMEDAEENLISDEGDTDGLFNCYRNDPSGSAHWKGLPPGKKIRKKKVLRSENQIITLENGAHSLSDIDIDAAPSLGGKEFYL